MARVLIVDDEPDILLMLRVNLEADGYATALAADGESALQRIGEEAFDLVLLDVMMPVMDGWGVLDRLATEVAAPLVIVVSAKSSRRDMARALEMGAVAYVTKPFSPLDLSAVVARVLAASPTELAAERETTLQRIREEG